MNLVRMVKTHPVHSVVFFLLWALSVPSFYVVVNFVVAKTPEQVNAAERTVMPPHWSAGVMSHGSYSEWWTIEDRPYLFGWSLGALAVSFIYTSIIGMVVLVKRVTSRLRGEPPD